MSGSEFFETGIGRRFYESTVPRLVKAMEKIATELEILRVIKQQERMEHKGLKEVENDIRSSS